MDEMTSQELESLLGCLDQTARPTAEELDQIASAMWAEFDRDEDSPVETDDLIVLDQVRIDSPRRSPLRLTALVAAITLLAGFILLRSQPTSDIAAVPPGRAVIEFSGATLEFDMPDGYFVADSRNDWILLESAAPESRPIQIAVPDTIFGGRSAEEFNARESIGAFEQRFRSGELLITGWSQTLNDVRAASQGCGVGQSCIRVATTSKGRELFLERGVINEIDIWEFDGTTFVALGRSVGMQRMDPLLVNLAMSKN